MHCDGAPTLKAACFLEGLGYHTQSTRNRPLMYYTTGFDKSEIIDICTRVACADVPEDQKKWPPSLGLYDSVVVTLALQAPQSHSVGTGRVIRGLPADH
jgi:hypothetical protein